MGRLVVWSTVLVYRRHSRYISPKDAAAEREALQGSFEGIGAYLSERDGAVIIAAPIEGSPAAAAGILPGDRVTKVDGVDMRTATITELQSKVREQYVTERRASNILRIA
jgi:carboxyl-terminal processing protease